MRLRSGLVNSIGKTISAVVGASNSRSPRQHLFFIIFSDGTHLELNGDQFNACSEVDWGGIEMAEYHAERLGAKLDWVYPSGDPEKDRLHNLFDFGPRSVLRPPEPAP